VLHRDVYSTLLAYQQRRGPLNAYQQVPIQSMVSSLLNRQSSPMVSSLLEVQNMASIEMLPPFMTVGTTTARTAPESIMSVVTDAEGMAKNGVET